MVENDDQNKGAGTTQGKDDNQGKGTGSETRRIEVAIDTSNIEEVIKRMREKEEESAKLTEDLQKAMEEKTKLTKSLEEEKTVREDFEEKLKILTEQQLIEKRKILLDGFKKVLDDEEYIKKIEEKLEKAEDLQAAEFMLETLVYSMKAGEEQDKRLVLSEKYPDAKSDIEAAKTLEELIALEKKLTEASDTTGGDDKDKDKDDKGKDDKAGTGAKPIGKDSGGAGQLSLSQQSGAGLKKEYDSHAAMIRDLRRLTHSDDPVVAAEAKSVLRELFLRWGQAVKSEYEGRQTRPIAVELKKQPTLRDMTKKGGEAEPNVEAE